jgi:flavorubredoxin
LIDPGSVLDFEGVLENVLSIVPLEKIKYVILHHQDPDFCASVPLFEQKGANFKIITHWRTKTIVSGSGEAGKEIHTSTAIMV